MKNKKFVFAGFLVTALAVGLLSTAIFAKEKSAQIIAPQTKPLITPQSEASRLEALAKFAKVLGIVEQYGVDNLTIEELMDKALSGMLSNIDAHSAYLKEKEYKNLKVQTEGEFGGLGISVGIKDGALTVIAPMEGTPADKVGVKAGDIILKIDDKPTLNMTIDDAVSIMRGDAGTSLTITVVRDGESKPLVFKIVRDIIKIESVYAKTINDSLLYIRVTSFDKKVVEEVAKALKKHSTTTKGIILDLRNNPGGLLDQAAGLVDIFVDNGLIVSQKGRYEADKESYYASANKTLTKAPLIVLINAGSASASEIVSGALQDHKRAIIVGEKSFGKGSVQVVMPITPTEALKLTVAKYYLPSGRTIQAVGVTPDIEVLPGEVNVKKNEFAIKEADLKKHLQNELTKVDGNTTTKEESKDEKDIITPENINKDIQLKEAVDIIKALIILKG